MNWEFRLVISNQHGGVSDFPTRDSVQTSTWSRFLLKSTQTYLHVKSITPTVQCTALGRKIYTTARKFVDTRVKRFS